jgi:hypothetical protein
MQRFWTSPACEVDATTVRRAYRVLGGREPGLISALLPDAGA